MVMVLTLKASVKELGVLLSYIIMGMFLFSTLITFVEYESDVTEGIPDSLYGKLLSHIMLANVTVTATATVPTTWASQLNVCYSYCHTILTTRTCSLWIPINMMALRWGNSVSSCISPSMTPCFHVSISASIPSSLHTSLPLCLSASMPLCLSAYIPLSLHASLPTYLYASPPLCFSASMLLRLHVSLPTCLSPSIPPCLHDSLLPCLPPSLPVSLPSSLPARLPASLPLCLPP